jgi:hypothetical protein
VLNETSIVDSRANETASALGGFRKREGFNLIFELVSHTVVPRRIVIFHGMDLVGEENALLHNDIALGKLEYNITVNAICPGFFPSKMTAGTLKAMGEERLAAHAPLKRLGDDEDLKGLCLLYASDAGKHITGQWLAVDGGVSVITGG